MPIYTATHLHRHRHKHLDLEPNSKQHSAQTLQEHKRSNKQTIDDEKCGFHAINFNFSTVQHDDQVWMQFVPQLLTTDQLVHS